MFKQAPLLWKVFDRNRRCLCLDVLDGKLTSSVAQGLSNLPFAERVVFQETGPGLSADRYGM